MERQITDTDIEAFASRVVQLIGKRLSSDGLLREANLPPTAPAPAPLPQKSLPPKLAYTLKELSQELGISKVTLYRLEARGLLKSLPYFRHKVFSREEVDRFLAGQGGDPKPRERGRSPRKRT